MINQSNGIFGFNKVTRIADILDGTSSTMIYGERANALFTQADKDNWNWWADAVEADTIFTTLYGMNPFRKSSQVGDEYQNSWVESASSLHPGGANFAFADGSVRFLKDSINSWPIASGAAYPTGVSDNAGIQVLVPGTQLGVYQKLSTKAGQELVNASDY